MVIRIKNLRVRTVVGLHPRERNRPREIVVNITLELAGSRACKTDSLSDTIDYEAIAGRIQKLTAKSRCLLIERLAWVILESLMADKRIRRATVEIDKPGAIRSAESVSVSLSAERTARGLCMF